MSAAMRMIWLITLALFLGGCSSYSVVYPPKSADDPAPIGGWANFINSGDRVRVTLTDDRKIEGKVTNLSDESLVVETRPDQEIEIIAMAPEEVRLIEMRAGSWGKTVLLVLRALGGSNDEELINDGNTPDERNSGLVRPSGEDARKKKLEYLSLPKSPSGPTKPAPFSGILPSYPNSSLEIQSNRLD